MSILEVIQNYVFKGKINLLSTNYNVGEPFLSDNCNYCSLVFLLSRFEDKEVQRDMKLVPYKIVNKDGKPYIQVKITDGEIKVFSPEEISAMILTKMKETAEAYLGKKIKDAVVTVPGN